MARYNRMRHDTLHNTAWHNRETTCRDDTTIFEGDAPSCYGCSLSRVLVLENPLQPTLGLLLFT